jgi:hypothetical protein
VPSKFIIHRARIAHLARTAARFHVHVNKPTVDLRAIVTEKNADLSYAAGGNGGTARALLRKVAPEEAGPLIVGSLHHEEPCFPVKKAA